MDKKESYLKLLIGETLTHTAYNTSTVLPINTKQKENLPANISLFIQLLFEKYRLNIYNTVDITPPEKVVNDFIGLRVVDVCETNEAAILFFESGFKITVDLRDEAYSDPEAMYLAGPENFWVVWN
jgi:hypothetical protein